MTSYFYQTWAVFAAFTWSHQISPKNWYPKFPKYRFQSRIKQNLFCFPGIHITREHMVQIEKKSNFWTFFHDFLKYHIFGFNSSNIGVTSNLMMFLFFYYFSRIFCKKQFFADLSWNSIFGLLTPKYNPNIPKPLFWNPKP